MQCCDRFNEIRCNRLSIKLSPGNFKYYIILNECLFEAQLKLSKKLNENSVKGFALKARWLFHCGISLDV